MTSWLLAQILPLSVLLSALLGLQRLMRKRLGASARYAIWLSLPVYLIGDALLPSTAVDFIPASYTVTTQTLASNSFSSAKLDPYFVMWISGTGMILIYHAMRFRQFVASLGLEQSSQRLHNWSGRMDVSPKAISPFVLGMINPRLVLPEDFHQRYTQDQQELIVEHERTHVRHLDPFWNTLAHIMVLLFWFHPLMWLAYRQFRTVQEEACDQAVMAYASKQQRVSYAHALVQCATQQNLPLTALRFGDKKTMEKRVVNALESKPQKMSGLFFTLVFACLVGTSLSLVTVAKETKSAEAEHPIHPLARVEPWYPSQAVEQKIEGSVTLSYDIETDGTVSNIAIVSATPQNVFNKSASSALAMWTYVPSAKKHEGVLVQLDYVLDEPVANEAIERHDGKNEMVLVEKR